MGKVLLGRRTLGVVTGSRDAHELGAVKVLRGEAEPDEEQRFAREVEVLSSLRHPAIVRLLDTGAHENAPYLVMQYAEGENLEDRLARGEAVPVGEAVPMFAALADGLRHAHESGIHHRDVKAENVVVLRDGHAMLVDFGVALKRGASRLTSAGFVMGTFAYLPPEVIEGGERDPAASDIYAMGQMLVEALTGQALFRGDSKEKNSRRKWAALTTEKATTGALDPGERFPDELRAVCRKATSPEPDERYQRIGDLADDLRALLDPEQDALLEARLGASWAGPAPVVAPERRPARSNALVLAVVGLVALGLGCGGALGVGVVVVVGVLLL
jgi:serine/threonine-protein kinase